MKRALHLVRAAVLVMSFGVATTEIVRAQAVVVSSTETTAEIAMTARVTTTTTEAVVPEPVVAHDVVVQQLVDRELGTPEVASEGAPLVPRLTLRAELTMSGAHDMPIAGISALFGFDASDGWGGGLLASYLGEIGGEDSQELHIALEAWRDLAPASNVGLLLVGRVGTALHLGDGGPRPDVIAQLGLGTRVSVDPRLAIVLDLRGELRVRPPGPDAEGAARGPITHGGAVLTMGLAIPVD